MKHLTGSSFARVIIGIVLLFLLMFPFSMIGVSFPQYLLLNIPISSKYIVAGILFLIYVILSIVDFVHAKRKQGDLLRKEWVYLLDVLFVDLLLIYLSSIGFVSILVAMIFIACDFLLLMFRYLLILKGKTMQDLGSTLICRIGLFVGILLMLFYNLPFELWEIRVDLFFLYFATIMVVFQTWEGYRNYQRA